GEYRSMTGGIQGGKLVKGQGAHVGRNPTHVAGQTCPFLCRQSEEETHNNPVPREHLSHWAQDVVILVRVQARDITNVEDVWLCRDLKRGPFLWVVEDRVVSIGNHGNST